MFPALYSVAVLQFNWIVVQETLSAHYIIALSLYCRIIHIPELFNASVEFLFSVPNPCVLVDGKGLFYPQCCDFGDIYLSPCIYFYSPSDLFYCRVALQCCASASVKSVCTGKTQGIKTADWSAFFQIGFVPKPWNGFWAFVNLALKLKWSGQHIQHDGLHIKVGLLTVLEENLWTLWKRDYLVWCTTICWTLSRSVSQITCRICKVEI